jgi:hypothetical protein
MSMNRDTSTPLYRLDWFRLLFLRRRWMIVSMRRMVGVFMSVRACLQGMVS